MKYLNLYFKGEINGFTEQVLHQRFHHEIELNKGGYNDDGDSINRRSYRYSYDEIDLLIDENIIGLFECQR